MSTGLNNFPKNEEHNPGGNEVFYFRPVDDIDDIPNAIAKVISNSIVFKSGIDGFFAGYGTPESLEFSEKQINDKDLGDSFEVRLSGFYPCQHPDYDELFDTMAQYRHVVLCKDFNARQRLAGNLQKGLKFSASFTTGGKWGNLKGYAFEFVGVYKERQPFYGEVPETDDNTYTSGDVGAMLYWDGTAWVRLQPSTSGYFLQTQGTGNAPVWAQISLAGYATESWVTGQLSNYYTKTQSDARYLQSFTETDPSVPGHVKNISTTNISNWNTAFGWGNHASAGYALASALSNYVPTSRTITINGTTQDLSTNQSWTVTGAPGGSNGQVQYNNAGALAGNSTFLYNGTQVGIGGAQAAATRLSVFGINADTSANWVARFTNIAGTSDYLSIRGDGAIGVGTNSPNGNFVVFRTGTNVSSIKFQNGVSGNLVSQGFEMGIDASGLGYVGTLHNVTLRFTTNSIDRFSIDNIGRGFFSGNFSFGGSGIMPPTTVDIRKSGADMQLFNTANGGNTDFYFSGNNTLGSTLYSVLRFVANNYTNGGLYYLPNTTNTSFASFVLTGSGNTLFGTTTDNPRSLVTMGATNKGFLPPRLNTMQRDAVNWVAGDAGMVIYNTTTNKHQGWNGSTWNDFY